MFEMPVRQGSHVYASSAPATILFGPVGHMCVSLSSPQIYQEDAALLFHLPAPSSAFQPLTRRLTQPQAGHAGYGRAHALENASGGASTTGPRLRLCRLRQHTDVSRICMRLVAQALAEQPAQRGGAGVTRGFQPPGFKPPNLT